MNGRQIVDQLRSDLDDTALPYLWETTELLFYANEAEREVTLRALLIEDHDTPYDASTAGVCRLSVNAGTGAYDISSKIIQITRVDIHGTAGTYGQLRDLTRDDADKIHYGWEYASGAPAGFIYEGKSRMQFVPGIPSVNSTARIICYRYPLAEFTLETSPEIDVRYHLKMLNYAKKLAYLKNDSDTFNIQKSEYFEKQFEKDFGPPVSFKDLETRRKLMRQGRMTPRAFGR